MASKKSTKTSKTMKKVKAQAKSAFLGTQDIASRIAKSEAVHYGVITAVVTAAACGTYSALRHVGLAA